jgi:hypothetical protein
MATDTCKLSMLEINDLYVNVPTDNISHITKLLLSFNNTDASARKIIVTVMHWFEPGLNLFIFLYQMILHVN